MLNTNERPNFELFKSSVCHQLKSIGDIEYITSLLKSDMINEYFNRGWYAESLYLLSMLDYLSRENNIPLCKDFDKNRTYRLTDLVYPSSVIAACAASNSDDAKRNSLKEAIPEFLEHNIVESDIRNVI